MALVFICLWSDSYHTVYTFVIYWYVFAFGKHLMSIDSWLTASHTLADDICSNIITHFEISHTHIVSG